MTDRDAAMDMANDSRVEVNENPGRGIGEVLPKLVFALATAGFLLFLAFGSVETRIWRFNRLYFEDRSVREVWAHFGNNLPDMPGQPVFAALFWISLVVLIAGTIAGLWLFLCAKDDEPSRPADSLSTRA